MSRKLKFEIVPIAEVPGESPDPVASKKDRQPIVLVVDDEPIIADTLAIILAGHGFKAVKAYSAEAALALCETVKPDLLLTDVAMPGMNGVDLAIITAQTIPECKVLLFSGQASTADQLELAREAGHKFHVLAKPVHPTDMLQHVAWHLGLEPPLSANPPARRELLYQ